MSNAEIDLAAAPFFAVAFALLSRFFPTIAGFPADLGFRGRRDGALGNRSHGLGLDLRQYVRNRLRGLRGADYNGRWRWCYLHRGPTMKLNPYLTTSSLLHGRHKKIVKHYKALRALDKVNTSGLNVAGCYKQPATSWSAQ